MKKSNRKLYLPTILLLCALVLIMIFPAEAEQQEETWLPDGYETIDLSFNGIRYPLFTDERFEPCKLFLNQLALCITEGKGHEIKFIVLAAGKKMNFWFNFSIPDIEYKYNDYLNKLLNQDVHWEVMDAVTGEAVEGLSIDNKGLLTADKSIDKVLNVKVTAHSPVFDTMGNILFPLSPQ